MLRLLMQSLPKEGYPSMLKRIWLPAVMIAFAVIVSSAVFASEKVLSKDAYEAVFSNGGMQYFSRSSKGSDLGYSLKSVCFGDQCVNFDQPPVIKAADDIVCYYYGDIISESYTALDKGVEQTWVINHAPENDGDIVLSGRISTPHRLVSSSSGLLFFNSKGRTILSYGAVTVIDSSGRTYKCMPKAGNGKLTITIPSDYVKSATFPIAIDPVVGPEVTICPTFGAAPGNQDSVSIAAGSNGYLAVWADNRGDDSDIFGCRLSATGEVLDVMGISISASSGKQLTPDVAWDGTEYLVVWADRREALQHIYCCRVRPNGEVLDPQGVIISGTTANQYYPRVAGDPSGWLVVWQDSIGATNDIYGCKVSSNGTIGKRYGISTTANNDDTPDVAYNGTNYFVVWRDYRNYSSSDADIYGCRVSKLGVRLVGDVLVSCTSSGTTGASGIQANPRMCGMGTSFMVVWEDSRNSSTGIDVYGARVNSSASVLDKGGIAISTQTSDQELPGVEFNGSKLLTVWRTLTDRTVHGARLTTSGGVLDASSIAISSGMAGATGACVAGLGESFIAGWSSFDITNSDAMTTLVPGSGSVQNPAGVTTSKALDDESDYSVAYNGTEYAVVWSQVVNGGCDIVAARLSSAGEALDETPVNITSTYAGDQLQPSIAWNGSKYLVVWSGNETYSATDYDIRGWFLDSSLSKLTAQPLQICQVSLDQTRPCVASNGTNFLVAWEDQRSAVSPYYYSDIYGALVSSSGTVTAASISLGSGNQFKPKVASNGSGYMVVWEDYRNGLYPGYPQIYGARVTSSGTLQDSSGIAMPQVTYNQTDPDVCYGGGYYFVTWSDYNRISGCRVSTAGVVQDTSGLNIDSGSVLKYCPSAAWDGTNYGVVWEDYRSSDSTNSDIYYNTVGSSGTVSSAPRIALVSNLLPQLSPKILGSGMLFYSRLQNHSHCTCASTLEDQPIREVDSLAEAKELPAGTIVAVADKVVTASLSGYFYMEDLNRLSGIKVVTSTSVAKDTLVDVVGTITISDGERQINCTSLYSMGVADDPPAPWGIRGDFLGGAALNSQTPGITGASGPNNIGLLATTWGTVLSSGSNYFYIQSKPGTNIRVKSGSLSQPAVGKFVVITGVVSCEVVSGATARAIIPRYQSDIVVEN